MANQTRITSISFGVAAFLAACAPAPRSASDVSSAECGARAADRTAAPVYTRAELDTSAEPIGRLPTPVTPQVLVQIWQPQTAHVSFVIDTLGCVERGSGRVLQATHPAWGEASLRVLPRLRFTPARKAGRVARQRADMRFAFTPGGG